MIADYATAERSARQSLLQTDPNRDFAAHGYFSTFDVADAAAFSSIGNPPGASALERGFAGISDYDETLVALAENRNIEVARGQIRQMIGDLGAIAPPAAAIQAPAQGVANLLIEALRLVLGSLL